MSHNDLVIRLKWNLDSLILMHTRICLWWMFCLMCPGMFLFPGEVQCEQPNNSLYTFAGNLIIQKQTLPLGPNQLLLRVPFPMFLFFFFCLSVSLSLSFLQRLWLVLSKWRTSGLLILIGGSCKNDLRPCLFRLCITFGVPLLFCYTSSLMQRKYTCWICLSVLLLDIISVLQGCSLRNTEYLVGAVIFTGHETKVSILYFNL